MKQTGRRSKRGIKLREGIKRESGKEIGQRIKPVKWSERRTKTVRKYLRRF